MFLTRRMLLETTWRRLGDSCGCYRRACPECGNLFYASRPEARYCRPACRQRAYRRRCGRRNSPGMAEAVKLR